MEPVAAQIRFSDSLPYRIAIFLQEFPFKIQCRLATTNTALRQREDFANEILQMLDESKLYVGCIGLLMRTYYLEGFVNKKNWHIRVSENSSVSHEKSLHSAIDNVWEALSMEGIIGLLFMSEPTIHYIQILQFAATY